MSYLAQCQTYQQEQGVFGSCCLKRVGMIVTNIYTHTYIIYGERDRESGYTDPATPRQTDPFKNKMCDVCALQTNRSVRKMREERKAGGGLFIPTVLCVCVCVCVRVLATKGRRTGTVRMGRVWYGVCFSRPPLVRHRGARFHFGGGFVPGFCIPTMGGTDI